MLHKFIKSVAFLGLCVISLATQSNGSTTPGISSCSSGIRCDLALNPSRSGLPSPSLSDPGWGGGQDTWDIVDGQNYYPWWAEGLALNYGSSRQITIEFAGRATFDEIVIWHHSDCCSAGHNIPMDVTIEYFDGDWRAINSFDRHYDLNASPPSGNYGSYPDHYTFDQVEASMVRWSYDGDGPNIFGAYGGWHGWVYEVEIFGEFVSALEVNLMTFIPGNSIPAVGIWDNFTCRGLMYFRGDSRSFGPDSTSYRSKQSVVVALDESVAPDGILPNSRQVNTTGTTRLYASDALPVLDDEDNDTLLGDCTLLHAQSDMLSGELRTIVTRTGPFSLEVRFIGEIRNPLVPHAASIDWNILVGIDGSAAPILWHISGMEDGFPAFEIYINRTPIYQRNYPPPYEAGDLSKLLPILGDVVLNEAGQL